MESEDPSARRVRYRQDALVLVERRREQSWGMIDKVGDGCDLETGG
jgi:hypothetical protein